MERDDRKAGSTGQGKGGPEPQHAPRPAPGRVTRTSRLETGQAPAVQRTPAAQRPASAREATGTAEIRDLYMDMAFRGSTALAERGLTLDDLPVSPGAERRTPDDAAHRGGAALQEAGLAAVQQAAVTSAASAVSATVASIDPRGPASTSPAIQGRSSSSRKSRGSRRVPFFK